jgi:hypothetical protein
LVRSRDTGSKLDATLKEGNMRRNNAVLAVVGLFCTLAMVAGIAYSQAKPSTVQVHMVITDEALNDNAELPILSAENVQVKQGKNVLKIDQVIPARDINAALQLFILIDDTCDTGIGNNLNDLRDFINAQAASTMVGVAYMSNATIQITQNLTVDHAAASKAVRLPRGTVSTMDSPYLSLISLVKSWPVQKVRREVLMVSDGIDRLRGDENSASAFPDASVAFPSSGRQARTPGPAVATTMPSISADADTASTVSQRAGVIVHSVYSPGVGRLGRNAWEAQLGQSGVAKITDETGGEYFALGTQNPVSFKPYLDRLQKLFDNQYFLVFQAVPKKKEGLQRVRISTEAPNAEIASANNVWVPAAGA